MKKSVIGGVIAASLLVSSAFAAEKAATPLPAGKPAGTKESALLDPLAPGILAGAVAIFVAVAASGGFNSSSSTGTGSK
jgi:hypothetical protein